MKDTSRLKRTLLVIGMIAATAFISPVRAAEVPADDVLLKTMPADCLFCIRINTFNQSLGKLDQYLMGASPIPVSLAMLVNMQLGSAIGDPMLTGINMGGDFGVFAVAPSENQAEPSIGMLIPVNNFKEFVSSNPNCKSIENGLIQLTPPNSPQGSFLLSPAGNTYALAVHESGKDQIPQLQQALSGESKLIKRLSAAQSSAAVSTPVWAYVNLSGAYEKYKNDVMGMIQLAQKGSSAQAPPGMEGMMAFNFKMLTEMFNEFAGDLDSITLSLNPEPTLLSIDTGLRAKEGSELAHIFVAGNTSPYSMTGYFDNNNAVNGLMKMNAPSLQKFYNKIFDIFASATDDPNSKEQAAKMKELTQKSLKAMGEEVSFSYSYASGQPPFRLQEVVEVRDSAAIKEIMSESFEYANALYKDIGIPAELKYQSSVSTYKNASIDVATISAVESDDPNNVMANEMSKMYGENFKYYIAQTPEKLYITMGQGSEALLKTLIDKPDSDAAVSGDIKIAMDTLKNTPYNDLICSVNVIKLLKGMGQMMQTIGTQTPGMPPQIMGLFNKINAETQSTLVIGTNSADGQVSMRMALPKQHLMEIVAVAMQIQQQVMQLQMQQQSQTAPVVP